MDAIKKKTMDKIKYLYNDFNWCLNLFLRTPNMPQYKGVKAEKYFYSGSGHHNCVLWFDNHFTTLHWEE
jgi:hypothetical protein